MAGLRPAGENAVLPFAVESLNLRGRAAQLGASINNLLARHNYPEPVAGLLAQAAVLTALLGSSLKFQGKFSLQTQTDGPVSLLVCDYTAPQTEGAPASLRAYARFSKEKLAALGAAPGQAALLGSGSLAFTIDQGAQMQLYQGIVALDKMNLEQAAQQYFAQSEQIPTKIRLASAVLLRPGENGATEKTRRAGGIMAQYLPHSSAAGAAAAKAAGEGRAESAAPIPAADADKWREGELLAATAEDSELTDPNLPVEQLLYRLFHEAGIRVFPPQKIVEKCSCSREKLFHILAGFSEDDRRGSVENGKIRAKCEFCSAEYEFAPEEFAAAKAAPKPAAEAAKKP